MKKDITSAKDIKFNIPPLYKYEVRPFGEMDPEGVIVSFVSRPHWWKRFWMWIFFGWRFKKIK